MVTPSRITIGVMGSASDPHEQLARQVGELLAGLGFNLLTGGGRGVMTSVSRAFTEAPPTGGVCIGIIPCASEAERLLPKEGYPNAYVQVPIYTHLPHSGGQGTSDLSRNHINVLSCAAIVALPGGAGTASEIELAIRYGRPVIVFAPDEQVVSHFPAAAQRARSIGDVEAFLHSCVTVNSAARSSP